MRMSKQTQSLIMPRRSFFETYFDETRGEARRGSKVKC